MRMQEENEILKSKKDNEELSNIYNINSNVNHQISYLENQINLKNEKILYLKRKNKHIYKEKNTEISYLKDQYERDIKKKNKEISKFKKKNKKLINTQKEILSSSSWKLTSPLRKFKNLFKQSREQNSKKISPKKSKGKIINPVTVNKKDICSIKKIYSQIYNNFYYYKFYLISKEINRINLFFNEIDSNIYEFNYLFSFLINFCEKFNYSLRIIYINADFEVFTDFLDKNKLSLPINSSFLNLKEKNFLEIGLNEKYVCTSWENARCLLNSNIINSTIYFYLCNLDDCTYEEYLQISNICYNDHVVILNDDINKLNNLNKYNLKYEININRKMNKNNKILCCDFGDLFREGIEILNYIILHNIINIDEWDIYIISKNKISPFHIDFNTLIIPITEKIRDCDLLLKFDQNKSNIILNNENYIYLYFEEDKKDNYYSFLDIFNGEIEKFNDFIPRKSKNFEYAELVESIFNKINEVL